MGEVFASTKRNQHAVWEKEECANNRISNTDCAASELSLGDMEILQVLASSLAKNGMIITLVGA